jgi:hypothetical protein
VPRQLTAWIALAAFAASLLLPVSFVPHTWSDDADFGWNEPRLVIPHPVTQIEGVRPATTGEHCAICHWLSALGTSVAGAVIRHAGLTVVGARQSSPSVALSAAVFDCRQARAPPPRTEN